MKTFFKKASLLALVATLAVSLVACDDGVNNDDPKAIKAHIEGMAAKFYEAVKAGDEGAVKSLCNDKAFELYLLNKDGFKKYISEAGDVTGVKSMVQGNKQDGFEDTFVSTERSKPGLTMRSLKFRILDKKWKIVSFSVNKFEKEENGWK